MKFILFDTETNGFGDASLLSVSAIKAQYDGVELKEIDRYNKFYYRLPCEKANINAINVNGLNTEKIEEYREGCSYPLYFIEDTEEFWNFCKDSKGFIAHNIKFDEGFVPFKLWNKFCTQTAIGNIDGYGNKNKKLLNLAEYYGLEVEAENLHGSMYDTEILFEIVKKMLESNNDSIKSFIQSGTEFSEIGSA